MARGFEDYMDAFDPVAGGELPLDAGIRDYVLILRANGVETYESCEGGLGHSSPDPIVRFHGNRWAGYTAFAVAMEHGLPVLELRRVWDAHDGELDGPRWALVFRHRADHRVDSPCDASEPPRSEG